MSTNSHKQPAVLEVEDLQIGFGKRDVVKNVSFNLFPKETLALCGESGSGKSVTALSIIRLLPEFASIRGRISLCGKDVLSLRERDLEDIRGQLASVIFQEPMTSLNPVFTAGFQISEALMRHRGLSQVDAEAEAIRLLERVRIPDSRRRFHQYPHTLSGGMRQRVMIAMALACKPRLLIADEPTTALDVTVQAEILALLAELQQETGAAILFITHDMGVVAQIADRVVMMRHGEIVEDRTTSEIFVSPQHAYTRQLLTAVPRLGDMRGEPAPRPFGNTSVAPVDEMIAKSPVKPDGVSSLAVKNLSTRFVVHGGLLGRTVGHVHAVENVSFSVGPGETLSLVGESGCGKSTTGRTIMGLIKPTSGEIFIDGANVSGGGKDVLQQARRKVQMVFQDPYGSLDPRQTIGSAIAEPMLVNQLASRSDVLDRTSVLLQQVGLDPDHIGRYPHQFSGGQRQRISIARALALGPKIIIADEAVSALDVSVKAQIVDLLIKLQEELGLSYLFISHDMAIVERVSHKIAVMFQGRIVEYGPRAAVIDNPQHPYTRRLLDSVPIPDPKSRRRFTLDSNVDELKSPIRSIGFIPVEQKFRTVGADHFVEIVDR
ncbi:putative ABC transporter (ATP-binding protein); putative dipeptide/oligopeptide/nickel transporter [Agrobacterium tumefaciens str. Kerr 14]|uniref:Glutathione import ATP-binding protein GsiA n=1 Tax=Agrobacterium tumefaciens str. Kerr 14 TaxID=1183424 RepID=A0A1S7SB44_AGRTU|nr:ABC transporter ATP-binding protein [Agrobacterium tumefaciens]CUX65732.1 putative ABC transporter (ATP-binding protein); putative dipeptide/oligopeptide/nickel transporter [Agrobacterium tumefaciens str. Kerr 14]